MTSQSFQLSVFTRKKKMISLRIIVIFSSLLLVLSFSCISRLSNQLRFPISSINCEDYFQNYPKLQLRTIVNFRHRNKNSDSSKSSIGWFIRFKRFLPDLYQSWIRKGKSALHPKGGIDQKFHVQLIIGRFDEKSAVGKNLRAALPDLSAVTADQMVDQAFANGRIVIRKFESLERARALVNTLKAMYPPIHAEIYDFENKQSID